MNLKNKLKDYPFLTVASEIAERLNVQVYLVGGFVRDIILKREKEEMDFLVLGSGDYFASRFADELNIKKVTIFKNFGTAHFKYRNFDLEFVGARKESYKKSSRKPLITNGSFDDDIRRRDFTINTLSISLNKENFGELIDKYNGLEDIENKIIKTPLDPLKTFDDDPLRIMRTYRFASQLNFKVIEDLNKAAGKLKGRLKIVSPERITDEFFKILASPQPSVGLKLLFYSEIMSVIFPEISNLAGVEQRNDYHHKDVFFHTCDVVDNISKVTGNIWLRFAALVHDIAKPKTKKFVEGIGWTFHGHDEIGAKMIKGIFRRMRLPLNKLEYIEKLIRLHLRPIALTNEQVTDSAIRRLIVAAGNDLEDLITLCRADITSKNDRKVAKYLRNYEKVMKRVWEVEEKDKLRAFQSPVRGDEIMRVCGLKPSKKVGEIKSAIEEAILDGKIANTYEDAFNYLLKIKDKFLN
ncbi:MAG TPA: HD domain-containing protein [Ignavibacteria bacterium]|nr:HD domain-containing protein [Ignavibacteria bacterium]